MSVDYHLCTLNNIYLQRGYEKLERVTYLFLGLYHRFETLHTYLFQWFVFDISKKDAFKQYLAYHEGWGNYKYYKKNQKVIGLAKKVEKQSKIYRKQLVKCSDKLNKNKYIIF